MAKTINLLLGVHNHQPVDNWDHVIEDATQKCYQPFLDVLEAHPGVGMSIHYTGYLLDWLVEKHPELIAQLKRLVDRGQVEMFTGGFYEPVLAIIPDADKVGQIQKLTQRVQELTGQTPKGMWLAERVWEPHLVKYIAEAGVSYFCVDDAHFKSVGLTDEALLGRYTSEEQGKMADIFPVSKDLRYLIPYARPQEVVNYLKNLATEEGTQAAIYFDDGEKFGVWPGTYRAVYTEKWLHRFFTALEENADVIQTITPSRYVNQAPSLGRIYLPTASYSEMLEWALPPQKMTEFEHAIKYCPSEFSQFIRGGFWRHFLVKYPEANNIHKKMLYVSQKVQATQSASTPLYKEALDELWKGQSNDIFWHGVFGGLYLTNLRTANYQHLLKAEVLADKLLKGDTFFEIKEQDIDCDGQPEVLVESQLQNLYFDPQEGGALFELDFRPKYFNLLDTLARRYEPYHDKLAGAVFSEGAGDDKAESIHDRIVTKEKGLEKLLHYDSMRRMSLVDHFFGPNTTLETLFEGSYAEVGNFMNQPYSVTVQADRLVLERTGWVQVQGARQTLRVRKECQFSVTQAETLIRYEITNLSSQSLSLWFSPEFNVNFLAPDAPDRYYTVPSSVKAETPGHTGGTALVEKVAVKIKDRRMVSKGLLKQIPAIGLVDEWMGIEYTLQFNRPTDLWRFPIETVSQSESGFEKIYQSSALFPHWQFELAPQGTWTVELTQAMTVK